MEEEVYRVTTPKWRNNSNGKIRYGGQHRAKCILAANPGSKIEKLTGIFEDVTEEFTKED